MAKRDANLIVLIGTNGTGKSTQMKKFLHLSQRNLIVPSNSLDKAWENVPSLALKVLNKDTKKENSYYPELNTYQGTKKVALTKKSIKRIISQPEDAPYKCFIKGTLFLDDFKNYIPSRGVFPEDVLNLFSQRRHRELDIIMAGHSIQYVNPELFAYGPKLVLFRTTAPPTPELRDKISNYQELVTSLKRINQHAKKNPYYHEIFIPRND